MITLITLNGVVPLLFILSLIDYNTFMLTMNLEREKRMLEYLLLFIMMQLAAKRVHIECQ